MKIQLPNATGTTHDGIIDGSRGDDTNEENKLPFHREDNASYIHSIYRRRPNQDLFHTPYHGILSRTDRSIITIGVASTVTQCGNDPFHDGAAILKYSLDLHSARHNPQSHYVYDTYILYHPNATQCVQPLQDLGFVLLERETPVAVDDIRGVDLRTRITKTGCCGEKELIKLEAYRLTQYPIVIHIDLDVMVLQPMDEVISFMLDDSHERNHDHHQSRKPITISSSSSPPMIPPSLMWPNNPIPNNIQLMFTKDYNIVAPKRHDKPFQGGFFMLKPNVSVYNEFVEIVKEGNYDIKRGWGHIVGPFYGGMTIQGLLPYYYEHLHRGNSAVELNRCIYNNMSDKPMLERKNGTEVCRTNQDTCEDCRFRPKEDVVTFHFTICQKPWSCLQYKSQQENFRLCREMNHQWYVYRSALEKSWGRSGRGSGDLKPEHYLGYCKHGGAQGYIPIELPYGTAKGGDT